MGPAQATCGSVSSWARFNNSGAQPGAAISTTPGATPFYIVSPSNPQQCGPLVDGQPCKPNWTINATGSLDTSWALDANFTSSFSEVSGNDTSNAVVNIASCVLGFTKSSQLSNGVQFGLLDPGLVNSSALDNGNYNITDASTAPCGLLNISIRASGDLQGPSTIGISNITVNSTIPGASEIRLTTSYQLFRAKVPAGAGNVTTFFFHVSTPDGIPFGEYNATLEIQQVRS